jgi:hypothetical protein
MEDADIDNPEAQLRLVLQPDFHAMSNWRDLDAIYLQVLNQAFTRGSPDGRFSQFREAVGAIVTVRYPLTDTALCSLLGLSTDPGTNGRSVRQTVRRLHAVLTISSDKPLQIIHPSFVDFLTNSHRCVGKILLRKGAFSEQIQKAPFKSFF